MPTLQSVRCEVKFAWWLHVYIHGVAVMCTLSGQAPDMEKVLRVVRRAMRVRIY